ncbi:hypothetical protein VTG60DRAFT_3740 [Thermothelomyces hinnuleus]
MTLDSSELSAFGRLLESQAVVNGAHFKTQQQQDQQPSQQHQAVSPATRGKEWRFRPGAYTPREFVREIAILFESIIVQLGLDEPGGPSSPDILMDGLRSSLSHAGPEATLPLDDWDSAEPSELTRHIARVCAARLEHAREAGASPAAAIVPGDPALRVYSPCEGHNDRGSRGVMMLYNEWLYQLTCPRDALIGFDNFEDVDVRDALLARVRTGRVSRDDFLEAAEALTAPSLPASGYGFQHDGGVVLPAARFNPPGPRLASSCATIPVRFLSRQQASITFEEVPTENGNGRQYHLQLAATSDDPNKAGFSVDLGRVIRGLDAATDARPSEESIVPVADPTARFARQWKWCKAGRFIVRAAEELELRALLGNLELRGVRLAGRWKRGRGKLPGHNNDDGVSDAPIVLINS